MSHVDVDKMFHNSLRLWRNWVYQWWLVHWYIYIGLIVEKRDSVLTDTVYDIINTLVMHIFAKNPFTYVLIRVYSVGKFTALVVSRFQLTAHAITFADIFNFSHTFTRGTQIWKLGFYTYEDIVTGGGGSWKLHLLAASTATTAQFGTRTPINRT